MSAKGVKTFSDFAVAARGYGALVIFATMSASFIGGGFSLGNAEKVYLIGVVNIVALWGFSFKELLVAQFLAPRMGRFSGALSPGDVMEMDYGRIGKVVTGFFSVFLCMGILGAQIGGMGRIFSTFTGVPVYMGMIIGLLIVLTYSTFGGIRAVVITDVVQFIFLAIGIPLTLLLAIIHIGGWSEVTAAVPAERFQLFSESFTPIMLASLFLTFVLGETLVPPYLQRLLVGKTTKSIVRGTWASGLFSFPFFAITGMIGLVALAMDPALEDTAAAMPMVIRDVLPIGLKGLVVAAVISIVMSSADSFLNSAAIGAVHDVAEPLMKKPMLEENKMFAARCINVVVGLGALVFALMIPQILDILIVAYNFWAPIVLVPLVMAILGVRADFRHFVVAVATGLLGVGVWKLLLGQPLGFDGLVIGVFTNFAGFLIAKQIWK